MKHFWYYLWSTQVILSLTSLGIYPVATFCMMFSDIGLACNIVAFLLNVNFYYGLKEGVRNER